MGAYRVYSRATPYPSAALDSMDWTQTADVAYTAHTGYPPQKLSRYGHTDWRWNEVVFGPLVVPPTGLSATPTTPNTTDIHYQTYSYVVSGIVDSTAPVQESRQSATFTASNDLSLAGNYNTINLPALGDFDRFVIYKKQGGVFGYIGNTAESTFRDENIIPILSETPLEGFNPFSGEGKYPSSVALHQQRLTYGGTLEVINGVWMSRTADFENMDKARPVRPDDSLLFSLVADQVNAITHMLSLKELIVLTGDGLWSVGGGGDTGAAVTPSSLVAARETGRGALRVKPQLVDDIMFYTTSKGRTVRTLGFTFEIDGYKSDNVSIFAPHLFTGTVVRIVYQEEPHACLYCLRNDGTIITLTWEMDQQVWGWSVLEIDGFVEDICTIGENGLDRLYIVVRRTIGETETRSIERMALPGDMLTACHLDASSTHFFDEGDETDTITGLWHLDGQTVSAVYNGYVTHNMVVENGRIVLPEPTRQATIGLRYEGRIRTLSPALNTSQGSLHVERQQITEIVVRAIDAKGISAGIEGYDLEQQHDWPEGGDLTQTPDYTMTDFTVNVPGDWKDNSAVSIKQTEPFPAQIVGVFLGMKVN
jgi:hypothetical protein